MAAANRSTGLQVALVFAVMLAILGAVVAFIGYRNATDAEARLKTASDQRTKADSERQAAITNLDTLKAFVGYPPAVEVGKPDAEDTGTIIGQAKKVITDNAPGDLAKPTVMATIQRLGQAVDNHQKERAALQAETAVLNQKILSLETQYRQLADSHNKAREKAEKDRQLAMNSKEQEVTVKEKEVAERQAKIQEMQSQLQTVTAERSKENETSKGRISKLEDINRGLRLSSEEKNKVTYDVPSGVVEWVDRDTGLVWINRGEADALRKGVTFAVYKQVNKGVAKETGDIKGSIEVTRIIGPHQSEARVTRSSISDPIIAGDPVFTPLWKKGQQEGFAFVGLIDLDKDGVSDRDILHDLVASANGLILDEVDDHGVRHPPQGNINVGTKFLVVGEIPDFTQSKPEEKEGHRKIGELHKKMREEAQEHGVRIVSLEDFLSYVGYEPGRRIFRPGVTKEYNLRQGMEGTSGRPTSAGRMESTGKVSGRFSNNPNLKPSESTGITSGKVRSK